MYCLYKFMKMSAAEQQGGGGAPKKNLNAEFVKPFLDAAVHVLKVQAQTDAKPGLIHLKKNDATVTGDISGVINIVSPNFNGTVVITFPEATFLKVMSNMLGEEFTTVTKDIVDGAGELTNMIFGQAKIVLNEQGYGLNPAIPTVVSGRNHMLVRKTKGAVVVVPFETNNGGFEIEITLDT